MIRPPASASGAPGDGARDWRALFEGGAAPAATTPLALGFELRVRDARGANPWASRPQRTATPRDVAKATGEILLGIRPLERSAATGSWVLGSATWDAARRTSTVGNGRGGSPISSASRATRCSPARPGTGSSPT
ncbi:hypothetical protein [Microbacterium sp.]|uniref:hypothetical protein n=1 Tax=Microbacterium sp. TaxID=51671 RepID=UPI0028B21B75|nr:hypothetical protein [Microbacterium sp.]